MTNARQCSICDLLLAPIWALVALLFPILAKFAQRPKM